MEDFFDYQEVGALPGAFGRVRSRKYEDYFHTLSDREFLRNFRFSKDGVLRLTALVEPRLNADREQLRGRPRIPPIRQVVQNFLK